MEKQQPSTVVSVEAESIEATLNWSNADWLEWAWIQA
jgi:hypothetical protein